MKNIFIYYETDFAGYFQIKFVTDNFNKMCLFINENEILSDDYVEVWNLTPTIPTQVLSIDSSKFEQHKELSNE